MLDDESISQDTLAVLERSGTRIQFVVSKAVTLDGKDYKVLLWDEDYMLVGLADEFLNSEFDSKIVSDIIRELDELEPTQVDQEEYVRERSKELLIDALENIIEESSVIISTHPHRWYKSSAAFKYNFFKFIFLRKVAPLLYKIPPFKYLINRFYYLAKRF